MKKYSIFCKSKFSPWMVLLWTVYVVALAIKDVAWWQTLLEILLYAFGFFLAIAAEIEYDDQNSLTNSKI